MDFQKYINAELLVLIPVIYLIGVFLKKSKIADKYIPLILGGISVILSFIWIISVSNISSFKDFAYTLFTSVTQGILIAGTCVYANQLYKQSGKEE